VTWSKAAFEAAEVEVGRGVGMVGGWRKYSEVKKYRYYVRMGTVLSNVGCQKVNKKNFSSLFYWVSLGTSNRLQMLVLIIYMYIYI
jgi:hypothetical protein